MSMPRRMSARGLRRLLPSLYWTCRARLMERSRHEVEMSLLALLCDRERISVDVGAAGGSFAVTLSRLSRSCIAFEPRPSAAAELMDMSRYIGLPIRVEAVALSDVAGDAPLRMLVDDLGRSTIEDANVLADEDGSRVIELQVPTRRLDDYGLRDVGFIKIDVEGHELPVLRGAANTLRSERPALLIEAEERHRRNAVADMHAFLTGLGYSGFFVLDGELAPMARFKAGRHQNPANIGGWKSNWARSSLYINNFLYVEQSRASKFAELANAVLRAESDRVPSGR
jgi:FkbM family methyltransferase